MKADVQSKLDAGEQNDIHSFDYGKRKKKFLVGILNCTPDSFYDGGRYLNPEKAIAHGHKLMQEGADLLDIGGESTRPGATAVSEKEEMARIEEVLSSLPYPRSIDSCKPAVIERAISLGVSMINDVTGGRNPRVRALAKESALPFCIVHAQSHALYPRGVVVEIKEWFQKQCDLLMKEGISPDKIILDPGIGYGKSVQDNLDILSHLEEFLLLGYPLYLGFSRKSFIQKTLQLPAQETLPATLALATMAWLKGVDFFRVHDVREHREAFTLLEKL